MVNSKHASSSGAAGHKSSGGGGGAQRHSQVLPDLSEHQLGMFNSVSIAQLPANIIGLHIASNMTNEADMYDMECMSPLYATPPHSPSSELSSPGQLPGLNAFVDDERAGTSSGGGAKLPDNHFARDTHMRIILGNLKENQPSSSG